VPQIIIDDTFAYCHQTFVETFTMYRLTKKNTRFFDKNCFTKMSNNPTTQLHMIDSFQPCFSTMKLYKCMYFVVILTGDFCILYYYLDLNVEHANC